MRQAVPYFHYARRSVQVGHYRVSYWDEGRGQTLVFVHGMGGCLEHWAWLFPLLLERFRLIALDLPGFGQSTAPPLRAVRLESAVTLLDDFFHALRLDQPVLVGHSMGAALALSYAARCPENVNAVVALCP